VTAEAHSGVAAGEEALARCEWAAAQTEFEAALAEDVNDPRALDGLAMAVFLAG
jgi:hypothetical protein